MLRSVLDVTKGARTRQTLLDLAIARFAAVGYQAASVAEICREAGMSTTAAYVYFATKEELFAAAVDEDAEGLIHDALPDLISGSFDGDWPSLFARLLVAVDNHPLARRVLAGDEGKTTDRLLVLPAEAALRAGLASAIHAGQKSGEIRDDIDASETAIGLETIIISVLIAMLQTGGVADAERAGGVLAVLDSVLRVRPRRARQVPKRTRVNARSVTP
ncbi:MAG: hypothetical protein QOK28_2191 [Actinomycetota bacterium]|jgi:AcrR family transcriptional regulator